MNERNFARKFILEAIRNKYPVPEREILDAIDALFDDTSAFRRNRLKPDFAEDLRNQIKAYRVLRGLDPNAQRNGVKAKPILSIYTLTCGRSAMDNLRTTQFVEDFGGNVPTPYHQVEVELMKIEKRVVAAASISPQKTLEKAILLADIYATIIRVHPFQDGNGRVARFTVLYLLTCWSDHPFAIPKVRNDSNWRHALDAAMRKDLKPLTNLIFNELQLTG